MIEMKVSFKKLNCVSFHRFLRKCGSNLLCLRLSCCQFVDGEVIKTISKFCLNLEGLFLLKIVSFFCFFSSRLKV